MPYLLVLLWLGLLVYGLIDVLQSDAARVRGPRKGAWIAIVLLVPFAGPIFWLVNGRPAGEVRPPARPTLPVRRRTRTSGPDDDPEFLAALARTNRQRERERRRREQRDRPPDEPGEGPSS